MRGQLPDLSRLLPAVQAAAASVAPQAAALVAAAAPVGTGTPERAGGRLKASHHGRAVDTASGAVVTVESDAPYARYVLEGTGAHEIRSRSGGVLRWYAAGGEVRFARTVHHPGTQANKYPEKVAPELGSIVAAAVNRAMAGALA